MNEINDEVKLTLNLMQADNYEGALNELQHHLMSLLEIKREHLVTETGLQAELERERERRFDGNRIASADHRDELECLVSALEKIADFKLLSNDGATEFSISQDRWRKFCEAQGIAASAIAQYRKEPVTHDQAPYKSVKLDGQIADEAKPLTTEELKAGGWWCADVSEECRLSLIDNGVGVASYCWNSYEHAQVAYKLGSESNVVRAHVPIVLDNLKQIKRVGNEFYWGEK